MRVAVLDIGSNTSKILVAERDFQGELISVAEKSFPCRIGSGLGVNDPIISQSMISGVLDIVDQLLNFSASYNPKFIKIVGTEALRKISNSDELVSKIWECFKVDLNILSGVEEASMVAKGLICDPALCSLKNFCAFDLGGGSIEFIVVEKSECIDCVSLPLGAVRLAENFFADLTLAPSTDEIFQLRKHINSQIKSKCDFLFKNDSPELVGVGGSVIFLRQIIQSIHTENKDFDSVLSIIEIKNISKQVNSLDLNERVSNFPQIPPDRADVFPAAVILIIEIMKILEARTLTHSFHNLRYGVVSELI